MCILVQKWPSVAWFACIGCDLTLVVMKLVLLDFRVSIVTAGCWKGSSTSGRTIAPGKWFTWTLKRGRCRSNMRSERERGKCGSSFSAWKHSKAWTRILPRQRTMGTIHGRSGCGRKRAKCFGKACLSGRDVRGGDSKSRGNRSRRKNCSEWGTGQGRSLWENTSSRPPVLGICLLFLPRRQLWINRSRLDSTRFFSSPHRQYRQNLNVWRLYPTSEPRSRNTRRHFRLQIYLSGSNPLAKKGVSCTHHTFFFKDVCHLLESRTSRSIHRKQTGPFEWQKLARIASQANWNLLYCCGIQSESREFCWLWRLEVIIPVFDSFSYAESKSTFRQAKEMNPSQTVFFKSWLFQNVSHCEKRR